MTLTRLITPLAFVTALSLGALPAQAQHRGGGGSSHGGSSGGGGSHPSSASHGVAVARSVPVYSHGSVYSNGYNTYYRPAYYGSYYRPYYYRPYYSFVPHFSVGFGLTIGYPVAYSSYYYGGYPAYSYGYPAPYGYAYPPPPPAYGYPPASQSNYPPQSYPSSGYSGDNSSGYGYQTQPPTGNSVSVQQARPSSAPGGVALEITPSTASVFVDGTYMGTGDEFGPTVRRSLARGAIPRGRRSDIRRDRDGGTGPAYQASPQRSRNFVSTGWKDSLWVITPCQLSILQHHYHYLFPAHDGARLVLVLEVRRSDR